MEAIFFYTNLFVLSFFPFVSVLVAGGGLEVLLRGIFQKSVHPELRLGRIVALGLVWTLGCFGVAYGFFQVGLLPSAFWSLLYFIASSAVGFFAWRRSSAACSEMFPLRVLAVLACAAALAALLQVPSLLWFPHIMDSTQLGWTNRFTDPMSIEYGEMNGAVGYSGLIFFTGLLAPHLPLAVAAASTKILLYFLYVLLISYVSRVFYGKNFRFGVIFVAVVVMGSSFGVIVFAYGKDSLIGVVLTIFFVASLADTGLQDKFRTTALFCGVAACMGVISVPFMAMAGLLAFLFAPDFRAKLQMAASHLIIAGPLAAFAAQAMAKVPFWYVALGLPVMGVLLAGLAKFRFGDRIKIPRVPFWVPILIVLATFLVGFSVLPYKLEFTNFTAPFLEPLDGKVGLLGLFYEFNPNSGFVTGLYILGPFAALWLWRKESPIKWPGFLFNQITLTFFLWLCQSGLKWIDGPSQWTLIQNSVRYFLPPVAAIAFGPVVGSLPSSWAGLRGFCLFFGLIFASSVFESFAKYQSKSGFMYPPRRQGVVQSRSEPTCIAADYFWRRCSRIRLLVDSRTKFTPIGDFQYFSPRVRFSVHDRDEIPSFLSAGVALYPGEELFLLTHQSEIGPLLDKTDSIPSDRFEISQGLVLVKINPVGPPNQNFGH
jgi:hypothetical protein